MDKTLLAHQYLKGNGIEFGALCNPLLESSDEAQVLYADRLSKKEALRLFPELQEIEVNIVEPDVIIDFNAADLAELAAYAFDFFIANHVLEHLVNPIQFLKNVGRVMLPGARFFLTIPDKDYTFDKNRRLTETSHLWKDYTRGETTVSSAHIRDFLRNKTAVTEPHPEIIRYFRENRLPLSYYNGNKLPMNPFTRRRLYDFHRERSIHVHVWNRASFDHFLQQVIDRLDLHLRCLASHDPEEVSGEMIYILEKY